MIDVFNASESLQMKIQQAENERSLLRLVIKYIHTSQIQTDLNQYKCIVV